LRSRNQQQSKHFERKSKEIKPSFYVPQGVADVDSYLAGMALKNSLSVMHEVHHPALMAMNPIRQSSFIAAHGESSKLSNSGGTAYGKSLTRGGSTLSNNSAFLAAQQFQESRNEGHSPYYLTPAVSYGLSGSAQPNPKKPSNSSNSLILSREFIQATGHGSNHSDQSRLMLPTSSLSGSTPTGSKK
jgi:hypothetical protein